MSCQKQNSPSPSQSTQLPKNFFTLNFGTTTYNGLAYLLLDFDESNKFNRTSRKISGYCDGNSSNPEPFLYDIVVDSAYTNIRTIHFLYINGIERSFCCYPNKTTNSFGTNLNLSITRDDKTIGGIIEGKFNGTIKEYLSNHVLGELYCGSPISVSGNFKIKIKD